MIFTVNVLILYLKFYIRKYSAYAYNSIPRHVREG